MTQKMTQNVFPFPHTPNPENGKREEELSNLLSSTSTNARARVRARERAEVEQYYCDTFGATKAPPAVIRDIDAAFEKGMSPDVIMTAMDETAVAPRPSWAYTRAILQRLINEGVLTMQAYTKRQVRWYARKSQDRELPF